MEVAMKRFLVNQSLMRSLPGSNLPLKYLPVYLNILLIVAFSLDTEDGIDNAIHHCSAEAPAAWTTASKVAAAKTG